MADASPSITISSAIHKIQLALLENPSLTTHHLFAAGTVLSKPDYEDIVTERSISNLCGYPLCPNRLPSDRQRKGRFRVSLREHKVYDLQETYKYCSSDCVVNSRAFSASLNEERCSDVDVSAAKVEEVLGLFGYGRVEEDLGKDGDLGVANLEIKEKEVGEMALDEWAGPSNAIEGYVPQHDRGSKFTSNLESMKLVDDAGSNEVDFTSTIIVGGKIDGVLPKASSVTTKDVSEMKAKGLEDVVLEEKKTTANKTSSKLSKPKPPKNLIDNDGDKVDLNDVGFMSSITVGTEIDADFPKTSITTQDVSELIARQLEDVVIAEKKAATSKTSFKSPKSKSRKRVNDNKSEIVDFTSTIIIGDKVNVVASNTSSVSMQDCSKQLGKEVEDEVRLEKMTVSKETECRQLEDGDNSEKKTVSQETALKSSLKTSGSKVGSQSVKWADEIINGAVEDIKEVSQELHEEDADISIRLASAEACAAALAQAAEAVASGEAEAGDAVSEAGILILPQPQYGKEGDSEADDDVFEFDRGVVKWPKKTVLLDTDMFDVEDSWHDTPPEGFSLTLSAFATMWMALFGWITCSSLAYIYGRDESFQDEFLLVNGREYPRKIALRDGKSSEIRQALDGFICRALPGLVMDLRLPTPVSTLEKFVGRLLDTMSFVDALPSFRIRQWQVIVLLFIDALSVHRLPSLAPHMMSRNMLVHKVLSAAQVSGEEYETMRDLIIPLGRLPQFSMQSGG